MDISPEILNRVLRYDFDTGCLFWLPRDRSLFSTIGNCNSWNSKHAGREAFVYINTHGYKKGSLLGRKLSAHRVIWAMIHGSWPKGDIDHIDHNRSNNRIENLRDVSPIDNARNQSLSKNNTSGFTGVYLDKKSGMWSAYVMIEGTQKNLGRFTNKMDAVKARYRADKDYNFHENHGVK